MKKNEIFVKKLWKSSEKLVYANLVFACFGHMKRVLDRQSLLILKGLLGSAQNDQKNLTFLFLAIIKQKIEIREYIGNFGHFGQSS